MNVTWKPHQGKGTAAQYINKNKMLEMGRHFFGGGNTTRQLFWDINTQKEICFGWECTKRLKVFAMV